MPWAKKNYDKISTLDNLAMVHPTIMCLPWTINMLHNPHANIIQEHKKMQQKIKRQCIQPTPMLEVLMGHHLHWIMMVSNVAYVRGVLSTWHSTTPPNLHMFADLWWSKQLAPRAMKIECHQCEYVILHIIGAKHGIPLWSNWRMA
jgi:hypothetical protein